ncbi:SLC13 family permease [Halalkalicoccus tibetensis]|uniref:SLC13 family permease n=1 Tax=Halalkalicoccus tibetensis TaxID=175632 RepID=A0ABD5V3I3_9EURY
MTRRARELWGYLWELNEQTKAYLRLDGGRIAEDTNASEREKELARKVFADGGDRGGTEAGEGGSAGSGSDGGRGSGDDSPFDVGGDYGLRKRAGFVVGPVLFALVMLAPTPAGLDPSAQAVGAVTAWVATWWMSEAIPIPATSLLPIVLFPLLGALDAGTTTAPYADPLIFLFMGGFFLAMAMQRWGLHRRIALRTIKLVGTDPKRMILGFMIATAFLSAWVSNSATVMMMVPIALAVIYQTADLVEESGLDIDVAEGEFSFGVALMLCVAYGASVGGVATLIGTPPNLVFAGIAGELFDQQIGFAEWMLYGVPISLIGLAIVYVYVTRLAMNPEFDQLPGGSDVIDEELAKLGETGKQEKLVLVVFVGMAASWIGAGFLPEAIVPDDVDTIVAIGGALALFTIPTTHEGGRTFLLDWTNGVQIPWGVILLFGGGLSIAAGFQETGLAEWLGGQLVVLEGVSMVVVLLVVVAMTIFLTEVTSNTASATMLMPILAALAIGISVNPLALMVAGATAASFAFMLPVATPPNAIVFGSGYITIPQMAKVGIGLNVIGILLITALALLWLPVAWGIDITTLPEWAM